jgi:N-acetylglucosamine kinase-like BadF-type ATPase
LIVDSNGKECSSFVTGSFLTKIKKGSSNKNSVGFEESKNNIFTAIMNALKILNADLSNGFISFN